MSIIFQIFMQVEEATILQKKKRSAESSESDSRDVRTRAERSALPDVRQRSGQTQDSFVVNVILEMGLPVFMADYEGFRQWLYDESEISIDV
jgi:hypothetical protein